MIKILNKIFERNLLAKPPLDIKELSGGCINSAFHVTTKGEEYFIKLNSAVGKDFFDAETNGLKKLKQFGLNVPEVMEFGTMEDTSYLIQKFVKSAKPEKHFWLNMGRTLAGLHQNKFEAYGLEINNYIGSLPQINSFHPDGVAFFIENRLEYQLRLAQEKNDLSKVRNLFEKLYKKLPELIITQPASMLHGDLWSGNVMTDETGAPVFIDPAIYYGNRESDLAFTTLFGGFHHDFYKGYNEIYPLEKGYEIRFKIFNLYPLLVHFNLFGGIYMNSVQSTLLNLLK